MAPGTGLLMAGGMVAGCTFWKGKKMANFKIVGDEFRECHSGKTVARLMGNELREYPSGRTLLRMKDSCICEYPSGRQIATIHGDEVREYPSGRKIISVADAVRQIEGARLDIGVIAFWLAFVQ